MACHVYLFTCQVVICISGYYIPIVDLKSFLIHSLWFLSFAVFVNCLTWQKVLGIRMEFTFGFRFNLLDLYVLCALVSLCPCVCVCGRGGGLYTQYMIIISSVFATVPDNIQNNGIQNAIKIFILNSLSNFPLIEYFISYICFQQLFVHLSSNMYM